MSKPKVSIIISNFNGIQLKLLKDNINSLIQPGYQNWELIVVDNASTDTSINYLQEKFKKYPNCFIVKNPINMYSQGLNLGAKQASGKYLAYFNNDTEITNSYLKILVKEFERNKKLAIAQGKLLNYHKRNIIDSVGETMDIYGNPVTLGAGEKEQGQFDKTADILSASGSACFIRKSIFNKLGGYDPSYSIGYEDMDLALRAKRLGYQVKYFPKAIIYHKRAATDFAPFIKTKVKWHFNKNRLTTMIKNYPLLLLLKTLPVTIALYLGISFYEWFINHNWRMGWVRISAIGWCIFHLPYILSLRSSIYKNCLRFLSQSELKLFSSKSFISLFRDFISLR